MSGKKYCMLKRRVELQTMMKGMKQIDRSSIKMKDLNSLEFFFLKILVLCSSRIRSVATDVPVVSYNIMFRLVGFTLLSGRYFKGG